MRVVLFVLTWLLIAPNAFAQTRAAFVVGNGAYDNSAHLDNPVNDANLIATSLEAVGFEVTKHTDLTRAEFGQALSAFLNALEDTETILFYFAGHGMQLDGENLLLGTDATLQSEFDVLAESIPLSTVADALRRRAQSVLIFLDACRDNPLAENFYAENFPQARSLDTRGLAEISAPNEGTMFFFAASPGQVAYDGIGRNSPFSLAVARHLATPGLEVLTMTKRVIADVRVLTNGRQNPTVTNDIATELYLAGLRADPVAPSLDEQAASAWEDFRGSSSAKALTSFAEAYPDTAYAALALSAAASLRKDTAPDPPKHVMPQWCGKARNETEHFICRDTALLDLHDQVLSLHQNRLDSVRTGAARGAALVDQREWRLSRDTCGVERDCLFQAYQLRLIALGEFGGETLPTARIVQAVQEELNRMSCGAGEPDGVAGGQTQRAYALAASLSSVLEANAPVDEMDTLIRLRTMTTGMCSRILRAADNPRLLEGVWRATFPTCVSGTSELGLRRLRLVAEGDGLYSGKMAYKNGPFEIPVGGRLVTNSLSVVHVSPAGARHVFTFEPGPDPDAFQGFYTNGKCNMVVTR